MEKSRPLLLIILISLFLSGSLSGSERNGHDFGRNSNPVDFLVESQHMDGGWGYGYGDQSFTEPTAFVLMALAGHDCTAKECEDALVNGIRWLISAQNPDGGWGSTKSDPSNIKTGVVVYSLTASGASPFFNTPEAENAVNSGVSWLETHRENHSISAVTGGWAWTTGTYDFAEPTAYGILGSSQSGSMELNDALEVLYDRRSDDGGWNVAKGKTGRPISTAVVLAAFKSADKTYDERIDMGLRFLENNTVGVNTTLTAAWSLIALEAYESEQAATARIKLNDLVSERGFRNPYVAAITMIALDGARVG